LAIISPGSFGATSLPSLSIIRILINGEVAGVIEALNKQDGSNFNRHDLKVMQGLASAAAMVLENKGMHNELMNAYKGTVKALVSLADAKETSGGGHSRRAQERRALSRARLDRHRRRHRREFRRARPAGRRGSRLLADIAGDRVGEVRPRDAAGTVAGSGRDHARGWWCRRRWRCGARAVHADRGGGLGRDRR